MVRELEADATMDTGSCSKARARARSRPVPSGVTRDAPDRFEPRLNSRLPGLGAARRGATTRAAAPHASRSTSRRVGGEVSPPARRACRSGSPGCARLAAARRDRRVPTEGPPRDAAGAFRVATYLLAVDGLLALLSPARRRARRRARRGASRPAGGATGSSSRAPSPRPGDDRDRRGLRDRPALPGGLAARRLRAPAALPAALPPLHATVAPGRPRRGLPRVLMLVAASS